MVGLHGSGSGPPVPPQGSLLGRAKHCCPPFTWPSARVPLQSLLALKQDGFAALWQLPASSRQKMGCTVPLTHAATLLAPAAEEPSRQAGGVGGDGMKPPK